MAGKRSEGPRHAMVVAAAACVFASVLTGQAAATPAALGPTKLVLSCEGAVLVATVRGTTRSIASVAFALGGKRFVDRTKPFTFRVPASTVPAGTLVGALYTHANGQPVYSNEVKAPRCKGSA
jgi:hypothetical protein